ncbi:hypothetical protein N9A55_04145 [Luminiphilus sp.]|jgi:hypothetical protein|nr:hypothetical protein [Luminiphilus sp.]MDA7839945.1 hypothetical protein [Luminiphilus sp.]MDA8828162.1 hypothetical protein [Luminiphilus sp.]MDA9580393.1 hypothetical protein [Luminiphilus sp.]
MHTSKRSIIMSIRWPAIVIVMWAGQWLFLPLTYVQHEYFTAFLAGCVVTTSAIAAFTVHLSLQDRRKQRLWKGALWVAEGEEWQGPYCTPCHERGTYALMDQYACCNKPVCEYRIPVVEHPPTKPPTAKS